MPQTFVDFEEPKCPLFKDPSAAIHREMVTFLSRALRRGKELAVRLTPTGATAHLKGSIVNPIGKTGPVDFTGDVAWTATYAGTVDRGGPPRRVPLTKLRPWASAVLGNEKAAIPVQKAIRQRGTPSPAHPDPGKGMELRLKQQWEPIVCDLFVSACRKMEKRLMKG